MVLSKKNKKIAVSLLLVCSLIFGTAYALVTSQITFTNSFQTGSVDIKITQMEKTEDGFQEVTDHEILPNKNISYIPRVLNINADSYVRVKFEAVMDPDKAIEIQEYINQKKEEGIDIESYPITVENVYQVHDNWIYRGGYFYNTDVMQTGESSDVFDGIHIPAEWTTATASPFTVNITAEAVQTKNFTPDFESETPWGAIEIEPAKDEEDNINYGVAKVIGKSPVMTYSGNKKLEGSTSDLFENFDYYMAGDSYKDKLTMKNTSGKNITIYFRTQNKTDSDLLKQMRLVIKCEGKEIYNGDLESSTLSEYKELTKIPARQEKTLEYEVSLPSESKNYYTILKDNVIWQFEVREDMVGTHQTGQDIPLILIVLAVLAIFTSGYIAKNKKYIFGKR